MATIALTVIYISLKLDRDSPDYIFAVLLLVNAGEFRCSYIKQVYYSKECHTISLTVIIFENVENLYVEIHRKYWLLTFI